MDQNKIGKFISECRKKKGLTQNNIAQKLGVTDKSVSKWERGICLPDVSLFQELCKILDISLNELFAGEYLKEKEIVKKSEENIINIIKKEAIIIKKYKIKMVIVAFIIIFLLLFTSKTLLVKYGLMIDDNLKYTQKYIVNNGNIKGEVDINYFEKISLDFEIGANKYGYAVFKNPNKAFNTFKKKYNKVIKAIKREFKLLPFSNLTYKSYKIYGWQLTNGTEEENKQASFVSSFLDIYENSFNNK